MLAKIKYKKSSDSRCISTQYLDSIPHADTLAHMLENIDIMKIEEVHISLVKELIHKKKFQKLLINGSIGRQLLELCTVPIEKDLRSNCEFANEVD